MRSVIIVFLLGALVACEKPEDSVSNKTESSGEQAKETKNKKDLNTILRDMNPYGIIDEKHPFYDVRIEDVESLIPSYIQNEDYTIKTTVYDEYDIAILKFWDKKPLCMVLDEKNGVGELVRLTRSENINLEILSVKDPKTFSAKGFIKYGDKELKTNFAVATIEDFLGKPSIKVDFSKTFFEGDIEAESIGFTQKKATSYKEPSFDISISYDDKKQPTNFSINHHKLWDGSSGHSMPSGDEIKAFNIENGTLRLITNGEVSSINDVITQWDVDIEVPIFEAGCEIAFK